MPTYTIHAGTGKDLPNQKRAWATMGKKYPTKTRIEKRYKKVKKIRRRGIAHLIHWHQSFFLSTSRALAGGQTRAYTTHVKILLDRGKGQRTIPKQK